MITSADMCVCACDKKCQVKVRLRSGEDSLIRHVTLLLISIF